MDIASLSIAISLSKIQESASISVMKLAMDARKEKSAQMTEMMSNISINPNLGQHLDIMA